MDGVEWRELLLRRVVPGAAKLREVAASVPVGMDAAVSIDGREPTRVAKGGRGGLRFEGESCE